MYPSTAQECVHDGHIPLSVLWLRLVLYSICTIEPEHVAKQKTLVTIELKKRTEIPNKKLKLSSCLGVNSCQEFPVE